MEELDLYQHSQGFDDDNCPSESSKEQILMEEYAKWRFSMADLTSIKLNRELHIEYVNDYLIDGRVFNMNCYQTIRPAVVFFIANSLRLLGEKDYLRESGFKIVEFFKQNSDGGYGCEPIAVSHLACTYYTVCALIDLGTEEALSSIDRTGIYRFLRSMQQPNGSFTLYANVEADPRSVYCALATCKLLNLPTEKLFAKTADFLVECQTYEGGFGSCPGQEAHGGFTFCAVASLAMLDQLHRIDIDSLFKWIVNKQFKLEGGFCGRTNKPVDSCYSFYIGVVIPIVQMWLAKRGEKELDHWCFDQKHLQKFILLCCQRNTGGGLIKNLRSYLMPDIIHTACALAGLSISQHSKTKVLLGEKENLLEPLQCLYQVPVDAYEEAKKYFGEKSYSEYK